MLGENDGVLERGRFFAPARAVRAEEVAVDAGGRGMHAGHDGHAGRVAGGRGAMGVGKRDRALRETVEVGRLDSGVAVERADVVVQIVDGDKEDIGLGGRRRCKRGGAHRENGKEGQKIFHGFVGRACFLVLAFCFVSDFCLPSSARR